MTGDDRTFLHAVHSILKYAADGELAQAQHAYADARALRETLTSWRLLEQIAQGVRPISCRRNVFYLGDAPSDIFERDFQDAIQCCSRLLDQSSPIILVNGTEALRGWHLSHVEIPGLVVISIAKGSPRFPDQLRSTIFHETAHSFLRCGTPLLDEGFAQLVALRFSSTAAMPAPFSSGDDPGLKSLLVQGLRPLPPGQTNQGANDYLRRAYGKGLDLVALILDDLGPAALKELFHRIGQARGQQDPLACVEAALGYPIDVLDGEISAERPARIWPLITDTWRAIARGWNIDELRQLVARLASAYRHLKEPDILDCLVSIRLTIARLGVYMRAELPDGLLEAALGGLADLINEGERIGLRPERLWTLRGHHASLSIQRNYPHMAKVAMAADKAYFCYEKAQAIDSSDPDLGIHFGLLKINTPEQIGGDRIGGIEQIKTFCDHPQWGEFANRVLSQVQRPSEQAGPASMPATAAAQSES